MMKTGYYQADTVNGVTFYNELMDKDVDIMRDKDFYESLDTLNDSEIIYTFFDESNRYFYDKIEAEYGIH